MNKSKKIEVNSSSLLDLKAELIRKQEETKRQRKENPTKPTPKANFKKPNVWSKQNNGVSERAKRDFEARVEEEDALLKSRKALEAKTLIYDQMTQTLPADDEKGEHYLVDFQRKVINSIKDERRKTENQDDSDTEKDTDNSVFPDEEWVDYIDSLGRSRRSMKKDLGELSEMDKSFQTKEVPEEIETVNWSKENDLLSDDMKKEIERQEWEAEEEELVQPVGPIHYQNVQHQEVRNHGVGYYAFSTEEGERKLQMDMLDNFRKQTEANKSNRMKLKEKRKAMLQARLAKVQERKNIALPLVDDDPTENPIEEVKIKEEEEERVKVPPPEATHKTVRPWDRGKIGVRNDHYEKPATKKLMTDDEYVNRQREDRNPDFAPPLSYSYS